VQVLETSSILDNLAVRLAYKHTVFIYSSVAYTLLAEWVAWCG